MEYFTYISHITLKIHVLNLINFAILLFINTQFTTSTQNILQQNQCTHGHVGLSYDFNCPGAIESDLTDTKMRW